MRHTHGGIGFDRIEAMQWRDLVRAWGVARAVAAKG